MHIRILLLIALCLVLAPGLQAQNETDSLDHELESIELRAGKNGLELNIQTVDTITGEVKDTTKIELPNKTIIIINEHNEVEEEICLPCEDRALKYQHTHWAGIDFGINGFLDPDGNPNLNDSLDFIEPGLSGSRSFSINFWEQKFRLIGDHVGLLTGAGLQWNSYRLRHNYTLSNPNDSLLAFRDTLNEFNKNKLRTTWLNVPLLMEFNTSKDPEKSFHIAAGLVAGLHLNTMYKQKYKANGDRVKRKLKNDFNVQPLRIEGMLRVGYGDFTLFGSVQLNELFEEDKGPEVYPFTLGLNIVAF